MRLQPRPVVPASRVAPARTRGESLAAIQARPGCIDPHAASRQEYLPAQHVFYFGLRHVDLVNTGRTVITEAAVAHRAKAIWFRNGLGRVSRARVSQEHRDIGIAVLLTDRSFGTESGAPRAAARDPFPGSPSYTIQYLPSQSAEPAWPRLHVGFFGMPGAAAGTYALSIDDASGALGLPVFDTAGRFAGLAVRGPDGEALRIAASLLRERLGETVRAEPVATTTHERASVDVIYERALTSALQVIVER